MGTKTTSRLNLVDLTCPHCKKLNSVAITKNPSETNSGVWEVHCAYCGKAWHARLSGPVTAGPFPK